MIDTLNWEAVKEFGFYFGIFFVVFLPLERLFSAHKQKVKRPEYWTDVLFFAGQFFLWNGLVILCLDLVNGGIESLQWLEGVRAWSAAQPAWLQVLLVILLCDVCIYWGHRLSHQSDFLWRFHRVHHTSEHLDWVAAFREHPVDNLYTRLIENLPAIILGFNLNVIAGLMAFRGLWGLFIHSNTNLDIGPLRYLLGSPRLHHWHHDHERNSSCNFANLNPLMDLLFGTYHHPDKMPEQYGISEKVSHNYFVQLISPLFPEVVKRPLARRFRRQDSR